MCLLSFEFFSFRTHGKRVFFFLTVSNMASLQKLPLRQARKKKRHCGKFAEVPTTASLQNFHYGRLAEVSIAVSLQKYFDVLKVVFLQTVSSCYFFGTCDRRSRIEPERYRFQLHQTATSFKKCSRGRASDSMWESYGTGCERLF